MRPTVLMLAASLAFAADWPQWRGPNRDGVVEFREPKAWPEKLKERWKIRVGEGHSCPIASGGKIFQHSRQGDNEVASAIDPATGKVLWQQSYPAPYSMNMAAWQHGKGVKSTPAVAEGRLFTLGISGILSAFDAATGKPLWRKEFSREFPQTSPLFGVAMSPVVERGMVIAHVGGPDNGALTAFDAATGGVKWAWKGDGPAYASPVVMDIVGTRQVVTQSQKFIVGLSAEKGELLWSIPFTTSYDQNSVTPVRYRDLVILSGLNNGVFAVKVTSAGGRWTAGEIWRNKDAPMYMNSPVVEDHLLFGFTNRNKGQLFCMDPGKGTLLWTTKGRDGDNAALVAAGSILMMLTDDASLTIVRRNGKAYEAVRKYTVADSATWAHPLPYEGSIYIKDATTLARWDTE
jgi:outer membrane protein assembly factor BamB